MSFHDDLCPGPLCGHPPCHEQQRLAAEVERLTALLAAYELDQDRAAEEARLHWQETAA